MARAKQKDARDRAAGRLEGRPKALRRELSDLETELERARQRRDRAQARVEALEAIAEQLTVAIAAADAARDARRASKGSDATEPEPAATSELDPVTPARAARPTGSAREGVTVPAEASPSPGTRRTRKGSAAG